MEKIDICMNLLLIVQSIQDSNILKHLNNWSWHFIPMTQIGICFKRRT